MSELEQQLNKALEDYREALILVNSSLNTIENSANLDEESLIPIRNFSLVNLIGLFESFLYTYVWIVGDNAPAILSIRKDKKYNLILTGNLLLSNKEFKRGELIFNYHKSDKDINFLNFEKSISYIKKLDISVDHSLLMNAQDIIKLAQQTRHCIVHSNAKIMNYDKHVFESINNLKLSDYISRSDFSDEPKIIVTDDFISQMIPYLKNIPTDLVRATVRVGTSN